MKNEAFLIDPKLIKTSKKFQELFEQKTVNLKALKADIEKKGFDPQRPVTLVKCPGSALNDTLCDGYSRRRISLELNLSRIWAVYKEFETEQQVIDWMFHEQTARRNLTLDDIIKVIAENQELLSEYKQAKNKNYYLIEKFKIKSRQATSIQSVLGNPEKLKRALQKGESLSSIANAKTETVQAPIVTACNRLIKLLDDNELTDTDCQALEGIRRAISQVLRARQKTA